MIIKSGDSEQENTKDKGTSGGTGGPVFSREIFTE